MLGLADATSRTPKRDRNIVALLERRSCGLPCRGLKRQLSRWAEQKALNDGGGGYLRLPRSAKSTIAIALAPDGRTFACTHGDHTVKIVSYGTGRVLRTLVGHPRTPWSVKFHPTNPRILASGCIGCEVRIWDAETGACLHRACLPHAIISLSFHPSGSLLAIASGPWLYLWDYHRQPEPYKEWDHDHIIRCVRFHPSGAALIMGAANSPPHARPQLTGTFRLVIWAFDARVARTPKHLRAADSPGALSRPRWLLDHALLYNDGGLDLSPCGRYLISCADLPRPGTAAETASACVLLLPPSAQTHARPHPVSPPTAPYLVLLKFDHLREPTMGGLSMIAAKPLERVLARCPSDFAGVTSVKFSPSGAFCILGYGVRRGGPAAALTYMHSACHAAAAVFSTDDLTEVTSFISTEDDVNIARFHPFSGYGLLYGTKQGRVRVRGPGLLQNGGKKGVGYDPEQSDSSEMSV